MAGLLAIVSVGVERRLSDAVALFRETAIRVLFSLLGCLL